jgi:hypothetical protein
LNVKKELEGWMVWYMIKFVIATVWNTKGDFENFNNLVMCKTWFKQDQHQNMYNENKNWFCSLDCMYAKKNIKWN